jgi:CRP-like cAMP-binding protein
MPVQQDLEVAEELRQFGAFAELPRELLAELSQAATQQRVHAGVTIAEQGHTSPTLTVLARGAVKLVRTTTFAGGESVVVLDVTRAPAVLADASLFDGGATSSTIIALRSSHVIAIDRRHVLRLAAMHPALARTLFTHLAHVVRRHVRRIDEVASGPVDERVRHLLDGLANDHGTPFGQGRFIAIPLRRRDIACMVNATTETVSRLLARFEREGQVRSTRDGIWWRAAEAAPPRSSTVNSKSQLGRSK